MVKVKQIIAIIEKLAPDFLAIPEDKIGLQIGSYDKKIKSILITLEITDKVIQEAIQNKCNLIISHHPFIFNPILGFDYSDHKTNSIKQFFKKDISLYVAHTNMDTSPHGINFYLSQKLGLMNIQPISTVSLTQFKKLIIYIPMQYKDIVRDKILNCDLFSTDKYSKMSFTITGEGTFLPFQNANPFIGKAGQIEKISEVRLEVLVRQNNIKEILNVIRSVHPYEEIAYDIYPVENFYPNASLGYFGEIKTGYTLKKFASFVKNILKIPYSLKVTGDPFKKIKKVGIICGSGASYIQQIKNKNLDLLITGDVKHHDAHNALENNLAIIDAGHYHTEKFFIDIIYDILINNNILLQSNIKILKSKINTDPFCLIN